MARTAIIAGRLRLLVSGAAALGIAFAGAPALAAAGCAAGQYPPGGHAKGVSTEEVRAGTSEEAHVGACTFDAGSNGDYGVESAYQRVGGFTASTTGAVSVSFTVPRNLEPGSHDVVFRGERGGQPVEVRVPFLVVDASGDSGIAGNALGLPRTGEAFLPMTTTGLLLVAIGTMLVAAVRRRRSKLLEG
jgi:hypothetical protein